MPIGHGWVWCAEQSMLQRSSRLAKAPHSRTYELLHTLTLLLPRLLPVCKPPCPPRKQPTRVCRAVVQLGTVELDDVRARSVEEAPVVRGYE
eukprot:SAG11_NODE_574_length_8430_cov_11.461769_9_plen_92_part_00